MALVLDIKLLIDTSLKQMLYTEIAQIYTVKL
jgi:hypothetical protein